MSESNKNIYVLDKEKKDKLILELNSLDFKL